MRHRVVRRAAFFLLSAGVGAFVTRQVNPQQCVDNDEGDCHCSDGRLGYHICIGGAYEETCHGCGAGTTSEMARASPASDGTCVGVRLTRREYAAGEEIVSGWVPATLEFDDCSTPPAHSIVSANDAATGARIELVLGEPHGTTVPTLINAAALPTSLNVAHDANQIVPELAASADGAPTVTRRQSGFALVVRPGRGALRVIGALRFAGSGRPGLAVFRDRPFWPGDLAVPVGSDAVELAASFGLDPDSAVARLTERDAADLRDPDFFRFVLMPLLEASFASTEFASTVGHASAECIRRYSDCLGETRVRPGPEDPCVARLRDCR